MGMFDWVDVPTELTCRKCGVILRGFQSKDADCHCEVITPLQVSRFYASCAACQAWNEFTVSVTYEHDIEQERRADAREDRVE